MAKLAFASTFWGQASEPAEELAEALAGVLPGDLKHLFFTNGGSDANDTALRMLHFIAHAEGRPQRRHVLSFEGSYHGASYATSGLAGLSTTHVQSEAPFAFQHKIPLDRSVRPGSDRAAGDVIAETVRNINERVARLEKGTVAALWVEPVVGTGGAWIPPEGWLKAVETTCRSHSIALVIDEVMTGFGRSGTLFATERHGVRPDLMVLSKGLTSSYVPMGAVAMTGEIRAALGHAVRAGAMLPMGFTTSGHPVAAAVGLAALRAYREESIPAWAETEGTRMRQMLGEVATRHDIVGEVRGRGQITAIELFEDAGNGKKFRNPETATKLRRLAFDAGLLVRVFPGDIVTLAPPLTLTPDDTEGIVARLDKVLGQAREALRPLQAA
jgi:adenosylmethionine-8-amino-7-oxononanoate aminotransferase